MALLNHRTDSASPVGLENRAGIKDKGRVRGMRRSRIGAPLWIVFALSWSLAAQVFREYDLKALFLYNFAQFVDWPPEAFESAEAPLVLAVVGPDRFGKALDDLTHNEAVHRRKLRIERYRKF